MYLPGISEKENEKKKSFLLVNVWVSFCHLTLETFGLALTIHLSCLDDPRRMFRGEGSRVMRGLSVHKKDQVITCSSIPQIICIIPRFIDKTNLINADSSKLAPVHKITYLTSFHLLWMIISLQYCLINTNFLVFYTYSIWCLSKPTQYQNLKKNTFWNV